MFVRISSTVRAVGHPIIVFRDHRVGPLLPVLLCDWLFEVSHELGIWQRLRVDGRAFEVGLLLQVVLQDLVVELLCQALGELLAIRFHALPQLATKVRSHTG